MFIILTYRVEDSDKTDYQSFIALFHDHEKFELTHDPAFRNIKWETIEKIGNRYLFFDHRN
ncbi:MAG: hypothetical protein ABI863_22415 [Ginsengibacter sp.]